MWPQRFQAIFAGSIHRVMNNSLFLSCQCVWVSEECLELGLVYTDPARLAVSRVETQPSVRKGDICHLNTFDIFFLTTSWDFRSPSQPPLWCCWAHCTTLPKQLATMTYGHPLRKCTFLRFVRFGDVFRVCAATLRRASALGPKSTHIRRIRLQLHVLSTNTLNNRTDGLCCFSGVLEGHSAACAPHGPSLRCAALSALLALACSCCLSSSLSLSDAPLHPFICASLSPCTPPCLLLMLYIMSGGPCLLYTSPSPRDRTRSRMPSSA